MSSPSTQQASRGATLIEYLFLASLVGIVCVFGAMFLGLGASEMFSELGSGLRR